jgi:hypothetical protein
LHLVVDEYQKNWVLRYMREAESDLSTAETTPIPSLSINLAVLAMRKMQLAIYHSLGDPSYVAFLVGNALREGFRNEDSFLRFLAHLEWLIQIRSVKTSDSDKKDALREAKHLMKMALTFVTRIVGEEFA